MCVCVQPSHPWYKRLSDEHAEDVCESDRLAACFLLPQSFNVALDVLWHQQFEWTTAHTLHQLLIDVSWAFLRKPRVRVQRGHVPVQTCPLMIEQRHSQYSKLYELAFWHVI